MAILDFGCILNLDLLAWSCFLGVIVQLDVGIGIVIRLSCFDRRVFLCSFAST